MIWDNLKSEPNLEEMIGFLERDWPLFDWGVQRIAQQVSRDRSHFCERHQPKDYFAAILDPAFIQSRGKDGDRFVSFGDSPLEALQGAYANLVNNEPDEGWKENQERRRLRKAEMERRREEKKRKKP